MTTTQTPAAAACLGKPNAVAGQTPEGASPVAATTERGPVLPVAQRPPVHTFDLTGDGLALPATFDDPPLGLVMIRGRLWITVGRERRRLTSDETSQVAAFTAQAADAISDAADH